jgi:hypothetical protein
MRAMKGWDSGEEEKWEERWGFSSASVLSLVEGSRTCRPPVRLPSRGADD